MIVRIDTTVLQRGRDSNIAIHSPADLNDADIKLYYYDVANEYINDLMYTINNDNPVKKLHFTAPKINGFIFASIKDKKLIKKVGTPSFTFCMAHKKGYTLPYVIRNEQGHQMRKGVLNEVAEGFYVCSMPSSAACLEAIGKVFTVKREFEKLDLEVDANVTLPDATLPEQQVTETTLPQINLEQSSLEASMGDALIDATIREL